MRQNPLSRRDFLKLAGIGVGTLAMRPLMRINPLPDFPMDKPLGRLDRLFGKQDIRSAPNENSPSVKTIYEDTVVEWLREVVGSSFSSVSYSRRWVETPEGYIFASFLQPVRNQPNQPLTAMPAAAPGFWAEVTVPYVDLFMDNPPARSPWARGIIDGGGNPRLYYSQVVWIDQIRTGDSGNILYRFNEDGATPEEGHGWGYGDIFWVDGAALRQVSDEEMAPISPDVDPNDKLVVINLTYQTLTCMEKNQEVYFCRVSSGGKWDAYGNGVDAWSTPPGEYWPWRKTISIHMAGGTVSGGWDTPAVSWSVFFKGDGVAIHSAFWHNDFGTPRSHGCVNCRPEDAKWIFRWMSPVASLIDMDKGSILISGPSATHVKVEERTI
jgi:hypothetical protein